MNKITIDNQGAWFDMDQAERFEAKTLNGVLRNEALLITPGKNAIKTTQRPNESKPSYALQTMHEARSWFRTNKYSQENMPELFRDFNPDMEVK